MVIRESDYRTLSVMCRGYRGKGFRVGDGLRALAEKLPAARVVADDEIPDDVVAIDSVLRLTELSSAISFECRIVLPSQVDLAQRHISVVSLIGASVMGEKQGQVVMYKCPDRLRLVRIDRVSQPEQAVAQASGASAGGSRNARD